LYTVVVSRVFHISLSGKNISYTAKFPKLLTGTRASTCPYWPTYSRFIQLWTPSVHGRSNWNVFLNKWQPITSC